MEVIINELSTSELINFIGKNKVKIIDIRAVDAYNGWKLENEARGGHIKGAKSLAAKWANYMDWIEIVRSKNILPEHKIIVYGYARTETIKIAELFKKAGYSDVQIYNHFVSEWAPNSKLPMEQLKNYRQLVYSKWVNDLVQGNTPPEYSADKFVICHSHYRNRADYEKGHIPGAIEIDTLTLESPETWNRRSPEELKEALLKKGITSDTTVILYGRFSFPDNDDPFPGSSAGHLGSIRCAAIMMYAGVKDVKVLNGGLQSWKDDGYEITTKETEAVAETNFGASIPVNSEYIIDIPKAKELLAATDGELVSVRSWSEFIGELSGYNYIEKKGRIPGAIFGNCGSDAYHMENYRNLDHTTREYHEIAAIWEEVGLTPDKHLAFYCGTGWRGSEAFFNAWLMGWPKVSLFDGGWFEWSNDPENPYETGTPEQTN